MPRKQQQTPKQRQIVGRVMREFKHGELGSSSGRKVENPCQAVASALHEAGSSRDETPAGNRRNLSRTVAKERHAEAGRKGGGGKATRRDPARPARTRPAPRSTAKPRSGASRAVPA